MEIVDFQHHMPVMLLPSPCSSPYTHAPRHALFHSPRGITPMEGLRVGPGNGKSWKTIRGWRRKGLRPFLSTSSCSSDGSLLWPLKSSLPLLGGTSHWALGTPLSSLALRPQGSVSLSLSGSLNLVMSVSSAFSRFLCGSKYGRNSAFCGNVN